MRRNLSKLYYKDYFKDGEYDLLSLNELSVDLPNLKDNNKDLTAPDILYKIENECVLREHTFQLKISYPGLVTGIGLEHELGYKGEFKLGVHFDYTYGMPVVYGSSVKGVLRSYFKEYYKGPLVKDVLEDDIFEGKEVDYTETQNGDGKKKYKSKSIYNRDIFFDAVIVEPDSKGRILASDSITPHTAGPLKNPTPITFLKIASGCIVEFRFKLVPSVLKEGIFSIEEKLKLFKEIICDMGIGAKTNVGYGQFLKIK